MTSDQRDAILLKLEQVFDFNTKRASGNYFRKGKCPQCGQRTLYTSVDEPWTVQCGREDNCKPAPYKASVRSLWPEIFTKYSERVKKEAQKANVPVEPNAVANLYMKESRGFNIELIKDWYTQDSYYDRYKRLGTPTVRFYTGRPGDFWERLIENTEKNKLGKKANWKPDADVAGTWWCPPAFKPDGVAELWIVEGIFDAIALFHHGIHAVAIHGCSSYPEKALKELSTALAQKGKEAITLVWALDGYGAGRDNTEAFFHRAVSEGWKCEAAQIPQKNDKESKVDWNDCHIKGKLEEEDIALYKYHGRLLTAKSAYEKAMLIYKHDKIGNEFHLDYHNSMWWFYLNLDKFNKARKDIETNEEGDKAEGLTDEEIREKALRQVAKVTRIAMFKTTALYFQLNQTTRTGHHYYQIEFPHKKKTFKAAFSGSQLASPGEFKKRLLEIAPGPVYKATPTQHDAIIEKQIYDILCVDTVDYVGYAPEYKTWLFGKYAVKEGKLYHINKEDYFKLDDGTCLKTTGSLNVPMNLSGDLEKYNHEWPRLLWKAFGVNGYIALAFWFGSLFAEQIKEYSGCMTFFEVSGEPGSGKTTLLNFMWKLFGRLYEGTDPSKDSQVGRSRKLAQASNIPFTLIESDRSDKDNNPHYKSFDWDEFKSLYNYRASLRARGAPTQGNEVYEDIFKGSLVIAQNAPITGKEAIMQRICHIDIMRSHQTDESHEAADKLIAMSTDEVSNFVLRAIMTETETMEIIKDRVRKYEEEILSNRKIKVRRIALNHAQLRAMVDALAPVIGMNDEQLNILHSTINKMAVERQSAVNMDSDMVQQFWDAYDYMHRPGLTKFDLNHSKRPELIAINVNHFYEVAREFNQPMPDMALLKKQLRESKYYKFLTYKVVDSAIHNRTVRCYVFQNPNPPKTP